MTQAIYMAIALDQDNMVTNMCLKFGEDWTNSFQELDQKQSSGRTYVRTDVRTRATLYAATLWGHNNQLNSYKKYFVSKSTSNSLLAYFDM